MKKGQLSALKKIALTGDYGILLERQGVAVATDGYSVIHMPTGDEIEASVVLKDISPVKTALKGMKKSDDYKLHLCEHDGAVLLGPHLLGEIDLTDRPDYPDYKQKQWPEATTFVSLKRLKQLVSAIGDAAEGDEVALSICARTVKIRVGEVTGYLRTMQ